MHRLFWPAVLGVLISCMSSMAQSNLSSGELRGTISDPSGAVVPGATVLVMNPETGFARKTISDGRGEYRFLLLPLAPTRQKSN